jgi:REP element-mobilizing transposase RayT
MILAFHCIFSNYGMWLPNEPRGSWSEFVASWELFRFGPATKVKTYRSVANRPYDRKLKREMQRTLEYDVVRLTGEQARVVGMSMQSLEYPIHALSIMPDHTHLVLGRIDRDVRRAIGHVKSEATRALRACGHFVDQPVWGAHGWNVYLDSIQDVRRAIEYVEKNPVKDGLPKQKWNCVVPFVYV